MRCRWRTEIVVHVFELEKGAEDNDGAGDGAYAHGKGETDLFPRAQLQVPDDKPGEQRKQDIDDAAVYFNKSARESLKP